MTSGGPLRVLIAENHKDLSDALSRLLDAEPDMQCVGQVASTADVLPAAREASADALILDLSLQEGSSLHLIETLAAELPRLRIVVFSGVAYSEELSREAMRRGAVAFLTKGGDFEALLDALRG